MWLQEADGATTRDEAGDGTEARVDEGTAAGTNLKPGQQLQDLIMGLLALVMTKDAGAGGQTAAATGSDSGEEKAAAEQGNGIITGVKDRDDTGPSQREQSVIE